MQRDKMRELRERLNDAGLGDGEFFVDGDRFDLVFRPGGGNFSSYDKIVARCATGETAYKLPAIIADALNAALRSTDQENVR